MAFSFAKLVAEEWERALNEMPWDANYWLYVDFCDKPQRPTYRQQLDRWRTNFHGKRIPRITIVRHNLDLLGNIRLNPKRLR